MSDPSDLQLRVLRRYLARRVRQHAAVARRRPVHLWFVARHGTRELEAIEDAARTIDTPADLTLSACFVEPDVAAFHRLLTFIAHHARTVAVHPFLGDLASLTAELDRRLAAHPAIVLADGAAAEVLPLCARRRELLVTHVGMTSLPRWHSAHAATIAVPSPGGALRVVLFADQRAAIRALRAVDREVRQLTLPFADHRRHQ